MSGWWRRVLFRNVGNAVALGLLIVTAGAVGIYILDNQRLRLPLLDEPGKVLHAEFGTAQAVIPGQGQTLNVSGVRIGDVSKVRLRNGRAIVSFDVDEKYWPVIREDATLLLRPRTGLKDMFVQMDPGTGRPVAEGHTIPVRNTLPDVNTDEFLAALDADTRDYVELLLNGAGEGLKGRGGDLAEALRRLGPTHRHIKELAGELATRERNLRSLTGRLERIYVEFGRDDEQVARLIAEASTVFEAFASEEDGIRETLREFPASLQATTDALDRVGRFGRVLRPAADRLRPAVRQLARMNREVAPAARTITPLLRDEVRPFVREARPLVRDLRPASERLAEASPDLERSFKVLNNLFNMIAFNQDGREGPEDPDRDEGYLFWSSWLTHNGNILFNGGDAHGPLRPVAFAGTCNTIRDRVEKYPQLEFLQGLTKVLFSPEACGSSPAPRLRSAPRESELAERASAARGSSAGREPASEERAR